jgi:hypothetical protein
MIDDINIPKGTKYVLEVTVSRDITEEDRAGLMNSIYNTSENRHALEGFLHVDVLHFGDMDAVKKKLYEPIQMAIDEFKK